MPVEARPGFGSEHILLFMPPRTRSARTGAASSAASSAAPPVLLDVLTTDDLLDLALSFCTEDALRAAYASCRAFRAAAVPHLRRLLSIALVGPTPQNEKAGSSVSSSRAGAGAGGRAGTPPAEATMPIYSSGEVSVFVVLV